MKYFQIVFVVVLAAFATACGQSKVEYKKDSPASPAQTQGEGAKDATQAAQKTEQDKTTGDTHPNTDQNCPVASTEPCEKEGGTTLPPDFSKSPEPGTDKTQTPPTQEDPSLPTAIRYVRAKKLRPYDIGNERFQWQKWQSPKNSNPKLSKDELLGLGDQATAEKIMGSSVLKTAKDRNAEIFTLVDHSKSRCIYRNRLIESVPLATKDSITLPPPFGNNRLYCVEKNDDSHSFIRLERTKAWQGDAYWVRWMGTTATKYVLMKGERDVEFKLTSRIYSQQAFPNSVTMALNDDMDQLLGTTKHNSTGQDCTLERVLYLNVHFSNGNPVYGKLYSRSRHFAVNDYTNWLDREQKTQAVGYEFSRLEIPRIHEQANSACRYQHSTWIDCLKSEGDLNSKISCDSKVMSALKQNFSPLLNERVKGFATNRIFALTRNEANGTNGSGALALWYDLETPASNPNGYNPLSLEDFQESTDIVDLKISRK